jgi:GTP-binding protein
MKGFVDEAKVHVSAGSGGNGAVAFHREPYKPKGGPDGGDGGQGGSVIFRADQGVGTLLDVRDHPHIKAERGGHGAGKRRDGSKGADRIVLLPVGTVVYDEDTLIADLAGPGEEFVAGRGGRGGRGNVRFTSSTRRAPAFSEKGEPGEERWLRLELRLLADVGLVGFPNAGKSTLISRVSAAKPKIAAYPFTTLTPNLGVVKHGGSAFIVADIPGLVEGASEGKGLGHQFLRHVRRAAVLLFLVDLAATDRDPISDVDLLLRELEAFDPELASRPALIAATKMDVAAENLPAVQARHPGVLPISAVTGEGIPELLRELTAAVEKARAEAPAAVGYVRHVVREQPLGIARESDGAWRVTGTRVERALGQTDLANDEAVERLQRRFISMGVERMLTEAGAKRGDDVRIGEAEFEFEPEGWEPPEVVEDAEA